MKRFVLASLLFAGLAAPASATTFTVWQGDMFVSNASANCAADFPNGTFARAEFRPANLNDNGSVSLLALYYSRSALSYGISGNFVDGTYNGNGINSRAGSFSWTSAFTATSTAPATVTTTTKTVTVKATIATFDDITGCTLTIKGTLGLRPDL